MPTPTATSPFDQLARGAYHAFLDAGDYVWKSPSLIETLEQIELQKLDRYYEPDETAARESRWELESRQLYRVFPFLMAMGNLFTVVSLFEVHLLQLAKLVENLTSAPLHAHRGQGVTQIFAYLRDLGIEPTVQPYWHQVDAALKIRNCLMHATGVLSWSRDESELRRIVQSRTYLDFGHRRRLDEDESPIVTIVQTAFGDRLQVRNEYPWLLTAYLRDYFAGLSTATDCTLASRSNPPVT